MGYINIMNTNIKKEGDLKGLSLIDSQIHLIATKQLHQAISVDLNTKDPIDIDEIRKLLEENTVTDEIKDK